MDTVLAYVMDQAIQRPPHVMANPREQGVTLDERVPARVHEEFRNFLTACHFSR
jgi:hypothetical protein